MSDKKSKKGSITLEEKLNEMPENELVYLGTGGGSSWLYICNKETLTENLEKINEHYHQKTKDDLLNEGKKIDSLHTRIREQEAEIKNLTLKLEKACQKLGDLTDQYANAWNKRDYFKEYLQNWVDMGSREVKQKYTKKIEPGGTALLITGDETGKFWTLDEVKKYDEEMRQKREAQDSEAKEEDEFCVDN